MSTTTDPLLVVRGLRVRYPGPTGPGPHDDAVRDATFSVDRGEVLGLVGASGCGKSSILGALAGLLAPGARVTADELRLAGHALLALDRRGWQRLRQRHLGP